MCASSFMDPAWHAGASRRRSERFSRRLRGHPRYMASSTAREERAPDSPAHLPKRQWRDVGKRAIQEFKQDNITDFAAALTYYGVLALFPALLVLVSILGLLGKNTTQPLIDNLTGFAPGSARDILTNAIRNLQSSSASGVA